MKTKWLIFFVSILALCCEMDESGFGGQASITGNVTIPGITSPSRTPAIHADVYVGFNTPPSKENYAFKTQTDSAGNFAINYLNKSATCQVLIVHKTNPNGIQLDYRSEGVYKPSDQAYTIELEQPSGIEKIEGNVVMAGAGSSELLPVSGAEVFIGYQYAPDENHYLYKFTTSDKGYFASPFLKIDDQTQYEIFVRYSKVTPAKTASTTLKALNDKMKIITLDANSFSDFSGTISLYNFREDGSLAPADSADVFAGNGFDPTPENFTFSTKTASNGSFLIRNVYTADKANYKFYIRRNYAFAGNTITLEKRFLSSALSANIILIPKYSPGVVSLKLVNREGTLQAGVQLCAFSDLKIYNASEDCSGSVASGKTNQFGKVFLTELQANGKYYLKGSVLVNSKLIKLDIIDAIVVSKDFPQEIEVVVK